MQRYSFDHITRAGVIMLIVMCLMGAVGLNLFVWFSSEPNHELMIFIPFIVGLIFAAGWLVLYYLRMHDSIVVTETGLTYEPASGQPRVVPWQQIAKLIPHSLRGRYDVLGEHGQCLMYIYYDLENFLKLDDRLREHFRQRSPDGRTTFTIHRAGSKIVCSIGVFIGVGLILQYVILQTRPPDLRGVVLMPLPIFCIWWGLYRTVERIVIVNKGLLIEYWRRTTPIPFSTIQGVTLQEGTLSIHRRASDQLPCNPSGHIRCCRYFRKPLKLRGNRRFRQMGLPDSTEAGHSIPWLNCVRTIVSDVVFLGSSVGSDSSASD